MFKDLKAILLQVITMDYEIDICQDGVMTLKFSDGFEHKMHQPTNYAGYIRTPTKIFKKVHVNGDIPDEVIGFSPGMIEQWESGVFTQKNGFRYERLTQYEYDRYCYSKGFQSANAELFNKSLTIRHVKPQN